MLKAEMAERVTAAPADARLPRRLGGKLVLRRQAWHVACTCRKLR
jgi:hypothetical protein